MTPDSKGSLIVDATAQAVLRWAAGKSPEPAISTGIDDIRILSLLHDHGLLERFAHLVSRSRPVWCSSRLRAAVTTCQANAHAYVRESVAACAELATRRSETADRFIVTSGFSVYALSADRKHVLNDGPINLVCEQPDVVLSAMDALGYEVKRRGRKAAVAIRGRISLVVSDGLTIHAYPDGLGAATATGPASRRIGYECLRRHVRHGGPQHAYNLLVPDPSAAVVLLCAQTFRRYAFIRSAAAVVTVRLGNLATIHEMAAHRQFDPEVFAEMVEETGCHDGVALAGILYADCYGGEPPFPVAVRNDFPRFDPQSGVWRCVGRPVDVLRM